ncbi:hypothetical protein FQN50_000081 [Emmonsiellopsis sp. PD_5]|nr:hypothetical protein FQN50_000081 [Emmonsiellopsis sp. PD_5]
MVSPRQLPIRSVSEPNLECSSEKPIPLEISEKEIPLEILEYIVAYLPRQDICSLRMVNHAFAYNLIPFVFRTAVVRFTPTTYSFDETALENIDKFRKLSPRISRFGLSFEIDQVSLFKPPPKTDTKTVKAFWGEYEWHKSEYVRFDELRKVIELADQVGTMRSAFKTLTNVSELALSFDTGYGWLNPPTLCGGSLLFNGRRPVFGEQLFNPEIPWENRPLGSGSIDQPLTEATLKYVGSYLLSILPTDEVISLCKPDGATQDPCPSSLRNIEVDPTMGWRRQYGHNRDRGDYQFYPRHLARPQTEWLLETSWAAQAILGSCICAVMDEKKAFEKVHTLNISSISSGLLANLKRPEFFGSFPKLTRLILLVIPDWKESDAAWGPANPINYIDPSKASLLLTDLLENVISPMKTLESLTIGYAGGGEHAKGKFARNQHILPAPITREAVSAALGEEFDPPLTFPHTKSLTFKNCWFSPRFLDEFFIASRETLLKSLTFDSCSLTALPGIRSRPYVRNMLYPSCSPEEYYKESPRDGTWSDIINKYTPCLSLYEQMVLKTNYDFPEPRLNASNSINRLEFISCGYVRLAPFFNQHDLVIPNFPTDDDDSPLALILRNTATLASLPPGPIPHAVPAPTTQYHGNRSSSTYIDCRLLGTIVQCIGQDEQQLLECGFGMEFGWKNSHAREEVRKDGFKKGGTGRFSGVLVKEE